MKFEGYGIENETLYIHVSDCTEADHAKLENMGLEPLDDNYGHCVGTENTETWITYLDNFKMEGKTITNNNATRLYMSREDEEGHIIIYKFTVKTDWLVDYIGEDEIEEFLEEYTSEDTMELYPSAMIDNAIVEDLTEVVD